jgi:rhomboid protease GluP
MNAMYKNSKAYMPTYFLVTANVVVYVFTSYFGGSALQTGDNMIVGYGLFTPAVLNGEVWRLFTSLFVHANIAHIAGNMLFLIIYGLRAEDMFDIKEYLAVYFLSGLAGNFLTMYTDILTATAFGGFAYSVGASGAIFGMLAAVMVYMRRSIGQSILSALVFVFFLFAINISPGVNIFAHLGGLLAGLALGYALAVTHKKRRQPVSYQFNYPTSYGP